jgi:transposase
MALPPMALPPVPAEPARVARAAFPKGPLYLKPRERVGTIIHEEDCAPLFAKDGAPGVPPWRLALIPSLQFHEHLSERQAAEAVRARIEWE